MRRKGATLLFLMCASLEDQILLSLKLLVDPKGALGSLRSFSFGAMFEKNLSILFWDYREWETRCRGALSIDSLVYPILLSYWAKYEK